jgi:hypothetical protein
MANTNFKRRREKKDGESHWRQTIQPPLPRFVPSVRRYCDDSNDMAKRDFYSLGDAAFTSHTPTNFLFK